MSDQARDDGDARASGTLLEKITNRFRAAIDLCDAPISVQPMSSWAMTDERPSSDSATRAQLWDLLVFEKAHLFPIRTRWYFDTQLEFAEPSELARQIVVNRSFDPNEFHLLDRVLADGMTFIDVGANCGVYTVFASKKVGVTGAVLSFEPSRRELAVLRNNIRINALENVQIFPVAIADEDSTELLSVAQAKYSGHNKLGKLVVFPTMPTLRLSTDLKNYHWMSLTNGFSTIPIGRAGALEVLIYSDSGFEFILRQIDVLPRGGNAGPWVVPNGDERPLDIPTQISKRFDNFHSRVYGDIRVGGVNQLHLHGHDKAGAVFRCLLDPSNEYTLIIEGSGRSAPPGEQYPVDVVTLDSILAQKPPKSVDVIKIDIEGAELRALRGAHATIEKFKPLLLIEIVESALQDAGTTSMEVGALLQKHGYVLFDVITGSPRPIDLSGSHGSNVVAVPQRFLDVVSRLSASGAPTASSSGGARTSR